jgi:hypothetical protein
MAWVHGLGGLVWHDGGPHMPGGATRCDGSWKMARARCQRGREVATRAGRGGRLQKETRGKRNIVRGGTRLAWEALIAPRIERAITMYANSRVQAQFLR